MASRDYIEELAQQRFQGRFRNAFLQAVDRLKQEMDFEQIVSLIEAGDVEGAVRAVGLEPDNFPEVREANAEALAAAGEETARRVPQGKVKFTFDPGNPRAERAVDELDLSVMQGLQGGDKVNTGEGKEAIRLEIRQGHMDADNSRVD